MNTLTQQYPLDRGQVSDLLEEHGILPTQQRIDIAYLNHHRQLAQTKCPAQTSQQLASAPALLD